MAAAEPVAEALVPRPALLMPTVFYLVPRPEADFLDERRDLYAALSRAAAAGGGPEAPDMARAVLDLAEFHFAHAMAVEGLSMLAALDPARLAPDHASRQAALQLGLGLIDARAVPLAEAAAALLEPRYAGWADQALFLALAAIREGAPGMAGPYLPAALDRLPRFPAPVRAAVLPGLLEAAIETGQWRIARDLAAQFADHAGLRGSPAYHFLLGRAAETGGDLLAAMDSYVRAGQGGDLWAHRGRVALVAMGLSSGTLEGSEAVVLLAQVRQLWWGDAQARAVLRDLAVLQAAEGAPLEALDSLGALINRYPASDEAEAARGRARELFDALYARGAAGEIPLAEFLAAHRRIAPDFRFDPNFAPAAERFADTFRGAGATRIAADEYGAIHDHLAVAQDLGLALVPPARLDGLRLKAAEALIFGGRNEEAASLLRAGLLSDDADLRDRFNTLAAQLYSATGASDAVIETQVFVPTESYLRTKAVAYFDLGDWAGAERAYEQLFALYGPDLEFADAVSLVLAKFRNGKGAQAVEMAQRFSELGEHPEWGAIVASLIEEAPDLLPLRRDTAQKRIDNAARTLERLDPAAARSN